VLPCALLASYATSVDFYVRTWFVVHWLKNALPCALLASYAFSVDFYMWTCFVVAPAKENFKIGSKTWHTCIQYSIYIFVKWRSFWPTGVLYDIMKERFTYIIYIYGINEMNKEPANSTHHRPRKAASPSSLTHMYHVPPPSCHHASTSIHSHLCLDSFIIELRPGWAVWDTWMVLIAASVNFVGKLYQTNVTQPSRLVKTASVGQKRDAALTNRRALGRQQSCFTHVSLYVGTHRNVL
jgi:hypothetical protein